MKFKNELIFSKQVALRAGEVILKYFDSGQRRTTKDDGTPVTIADTTINTMVIEAVKEALPNDEIVGEEESTADYGKGRRRICDPIDGTAAFIAGFQAQHFP